MIEILKEPGTVQRDFPAKYRQFMRHDIDMSALPVLIYPTLHYQNGGIEINEKCETQIPGLFVAGEASGGVHGKNRLMGNSLLDYNVFGRRAGIFAAEYVKNKTPGKLTLDHIDKFNKMLDDGNIKTDMKAPMIIPEYRGKEALARLLDIL